METPRLVSPPTALQTLPIEINTATRLVHTTLNRLITSRLPLALPPQSNNPLLYAHGISAFAHIYYTFEEVWHDFIRSLSQASRAESSIVIGGPSRDKTVQEQELEQYIAALVPPELWRSGRLQEDIQHLDEIHALHLKCKHPPSEVLEVICLHIRRVVEEKPHVLIAYSWVMYMAIFSGGRWIRQQLREAGPAFWDPRTRRAYQGEDAVLERPGFSFLCFDGSDDGEDIKTEFKKRLSDAEDILTIVDRMDIVNEAQTIFTNCIAIVEDLDGRLQTSDEITLMKAVTDVEPKAAEPSRLDATRPANEWLSSIVHPLTALLAIFLACSLWFTLNAYGNSSSSSHFQLLST